MPRPPPRPLRLPDLVTNPQARAEYIQSHPPIYSPHASSSRTDSTRYSNAPPSPSSTTDANSHRASAATFASSSSPVTTASTHTSLSVHNAPWISDLGKRISGSASGLMPTSEGVEEGAALAGASTGSTKPRASWSSALASTKSWFGSSTVTEINETGLTAGKKSGQKEIKLSPSMIAAYAATSLSPRPVSSPYPFTAEPPPISPTGSTFSSSSSRTPRVGSGLRYYTERNPAPARARVQIPDPVDSQDHDPPRPTLPHDPNGVTPTLTTFAGLSKQPLLDRTSHRGLDVAELKDKAISRGETRGPPSPPPTPPMNVRDSDVPDIRISSGDDL